MMCELECAEVVLFYRYMFFRKMPLRHRVFDTTNRREKINATKEPTQRFHFNENLLSSKNHSIC